MKRRPRPVERAVEIALALTASLAILAIVLIFVFVAREALPMLPKLGTLLAKTGDDGGHAWQPVGARPKLDILPLLAGSAKVSLMSLALAVPVAIAAALATTELLGAKMRRVVGPAIELLAGVPSVVLGLVALVIVAPRLQAMMGLTYASNALLASLALSLAVAPIVYAVSVEAFTSVPRELREASAALGARRWQTALHVVVPASAPGLLAACTLGFGRAVGETMIVLMTSGNAAVFDLSPTSGARTITATIAAELGETSRGGEHWQVLFLLGLVLVSFTAVLDLAGRALAMWFSRRRGFPTLGRSALGVPRLVSV